MTPILEVKGLSKHFPVRRGLFRRAIGAVRALDGVDLVMPDGEAFALVGESGSGKTTLGRCIMRLIEPSAGEIRFRGEDLLALRGRALRSRRKSFQMVFQDPFSSLNPRLRIGAMLTEPLAVHGLEMRGDRRRRVEELLGLVGLEADVAGRYPHEFSGGQRQRIGIARALATEPDLIIADEPVSALDVSVRAQIMNLLSRLQSQLGLTLLLIAHDLALVEQTSDRCGVLYLGRLVEVGPTAEVFRLPQHPYTVGLLDSVPVPEPGRRPRAVVHGEVPSAMAPPPGCPYHPRCPIAENRCREDVPVLEATAEGRMVACHYPGKLARRDPAEGRGAPDGVASDEISPSGPDSM